MTMPPLWVTIVAAYVAMTAYEIRRLVREKRDAASGGAFLRVCRSYDGFVRGEGAVPVSWTPTQAVWRLPDGSTVVLWCET